MEEYVVSIQNREDLEQFYDDMETPGGTETIPDREVECSNRRTISRNTEYILTSEEAETLKNDERVLDVIPKSILDSMVIKPLWTQFSDDWNKDTEDVIANTQKNWALYRCTTGSTVSNWGEDGLVRAVSGTVTTTSSGKNVDFVLVDGHLNPSHPEFSRNEDGTGGTRVIQYNWYKHTAELGLGANGNYVYPTGASLLNADDNHGMHVCGTVAGNTQGWARDANIYNISPYTSNPNTLAWNYLFDYIRAWHNSKTVNPITGRKNPTVLNNSWGSSYQFLKSSVSSITYRGTTYSGPFSDAQFNSYGIVDLDPFQTAYFYVNAYYIPYVLDIEDAVNDGIIFVGAAGNESTRLDVEGGIDYNNYITYGGFPYYYHRGSYSTAAARSGVGEQRLSICVGSISAKVLQLKNIFSNCGPRVDIYAPGENIVSSLHSSGSSTFLVGDPRNSAFKLGKYQGTSMASPQVCGVVACLLEQYPNMNQKDIEDYLKQHATKNQIQFSGSGYTDYFALQGSENLYLFYKKERLENGVSNPRTTYSARKSSENGVKYPRINMRFTKRST